MPSGTARLYVGNIPFKTTDEDLKFLFAEFGTVVFTRTCTDPDTKRPRGFGFVEMSSAEEAAKAREALNGALYGGREIAVAPAKPKPEKQG